MNRRVSIDPSNAFPVEEFRLNTMIEIDLTVADEVAELPPDARAGSLHIAREALSNAARHSGATSVSVRLGPAEDALALEVADNGRGFDPATAGGAGHLGLANMAARVASLGGSLNVDSASGRGTRIIVRIPATIHGKDFPRDGADSRPSAAAASR